VNVLVLSDPFPGLKDFFLGRSDSDSGQPAFHQVVRELDRQGHKVLIIVPSDEDETEATTVWTGTQVLAYRRVLRRGRLPERIRWNDLSLRFLLDIVQSTWLGHRWTSQHAPDLIVGHAEFSIVAAYLIGKLRHVPIVSRIYGNTLLARAGRKLTPWQLAWNLKRIVPFIVPADLYICTQDGSRCDLLARLFGVPHSKFLHVMNGTDRPRVPPPSPLGDRTEITFVGHLQGWKKPMRLLSLVPRVTASKLLVHFNFVGSGADEGQLRRFVDRTSIASFVTFHGRLPQREKDEILRGSDIFVSFASCSNLNNTVLEAMTQGKAILALKEGLSGVIRDGENGLLLQNWDEELALQKLNWLIEHPEERRRLGACARQWADRNLMSWRERASLEVSYYERVALRAATRVGGGRLARPPGH
jgi:L-malate glycosyltransferase